MSSLSGDKQPHTRRSNPVATRDRISEAETQSKRNNSNNMGRVVEEGKATELEWELEEGIPRFDDPFIQKYLHGREALIEEEQKQRHGEVHNIYACLYVSSSSR